MAPSSSSSTTTTASTEQPLSVDERQWSILPRPIFFLVIRCLNHATHCQPCYQSGDMEDGHGGQLRGSGGSQNAYDRHQDVNLAHKYSERLANETAIITDSDSADIDGGRTETNASLSAPESSRAHAWTAPAALMMTDEDQITDAGRPTPPVSSSSRPYSRLIHNSLEIFPLSDGEAEEDEDEGEYEDTHGEDGDVDVDGDKNQDDAVHVIDYGDHGDHDDHDDDEDSSDDGDDDDDDDNNNNVGINSRSQAREGGAGNAARKGYWRRRTLIYN